MQVIRTIKKYVVAGPSSTSPIGVDLVVSMAIARESWLNEGTFGGISK
jgi:hypothetical protein